MDGGDHPAATHLLMAGGFLFLPDLNPPEAPQNLRRLTPAEATSCRTNGIQFLTMPCVPIPEHK